MPDGGSGGRGMSELDRTTRPKARKQHLCGECGATIFPGEVYVSWSSLDEGVFVSGKACGACDELAHALYDRGFEGYDGNLPYLPEVDDWGGIRFDWPELGPQVDAYLMRTGTLR